MEKDQVELGKEVVDQITGCKGIVTSKHIYLTGCNQFGIQPAMGTDNKIPKKEYFDEGRLVVIGKGVNPEDVQVKKPGCDFREHPSD